MEKIRAIIFDWGGVLAEDPAPGLVSYCAKHLGVGEAEYSRAYKACMQDFQTGRVTEEQFWMNMTGRLKVPMPRVNSLWGEAFAAAYKARPEMFDFARRLHEAGYKTAILSNTEKPVNEFFPKETYEGFDVVVLSCFEGVSKPDKAIYELTLARLGTKAEETLFIDDRQDYLDGAKRAGLQTLLFTNVSQLKTDLANILDKTGNGYRNVT